MKRLWGILSAVILALLCFTACNAGNATGGETGGGESGKPPIGSEEAAPPVGSAEDILIAYFSCTNTTEAVARHIQAETEGTLYKIVPQVPYTADDLKYYTNGRADKEQADPAARPAIAGGAEGMEKYGVVFLGYPIWHGQAPRIISTFLESYDFSGKKIIPFCTSASSGVGSSDTSLHALAPNADWAAGRRFPSGTEQETVAEWIGGLTLKKDYREMYVTVNERKLKVSLEKNSSVEALVALLEQGDIVYTADDYGDFEKVGDIGHTLPRNDTQITTQAGDVILYQGKSICLYYGANSWSFTRIGKIAGYSEAELRTLLGAGGGSVSVKLSLA